MTKFKKDSKDKVVKDMMGLVDPYWEEDLSKVLTYGAIKYKLNNWKNASLKDLRHYEDALFRHMNAYRRGYFYDHESNLSHLAHAGANLMFLHYFWRKYGWSTNKI